jgi:hypothetical protein
MTRSRCASSPFPFLESGINLLLSVRQHCENQFLRSLYSKTFRPTAHPNHNASAYQITSQIDMPKADLESDIEGFAGSPRANHLRTAARETISRGVLFFPLIFLFLRLMLSLFYS